MPKFHLSLGRILSLVIAILVAGQLLVNFYKERKTMAEMDLEPSRVVCIGRILIDLPIRMQSYYGMTYFAGWHITTRTESVESFRARLQERITALSNAKNGYGQESLEATKEAGGDWEGKILQFDRESLRAVDFGVVSYEDIVKIEGLVHSHGISFDFSGGVRTDDDFEKLFALIERLKLRRPEEVPTESGFCIDHGIIVGKENPSLSEGITLFAGAADLPDVSLVVDSTAGTKASDTLLQRVAKSSIRKEYPSSFKNLRHRARQINGHQGEEALTTVTEDNGNSNHSFVWESIPIKEDIYHPQFRVELVTGDNTTLKVNKTPFTDNEAIALWDRITSTLRNRPFD
jgi:hypothetical protein